MLIQETEFFSRRVQRLLDPESYRLLQLRLAADPEAGSLVSGTGGLRKIRWRTLDRRGGVQVKKDLFAELEASIRQGGGILKETEAAARTFELPEKDVTAIREAYGLSQAKFASLLGISVRTLQNWEQGRRSPRGPARVLLRVAARHPDAVLDVVRPRRKRSREVPAR